jgi:hypothetical protein
MYLDLLSVISTSAHLSVQPQTSLATSPTLVTSEASEDCTSPSPLLSITHLQSPAWRPLAVSTSNSLNTIHIYLPFPFPFPPPSSSAPLNFKSLKTGTRDSPPSHQAYLTPHFGTTISCTSHLQLTSITITITNLSTRLHYLSR